jgi:hypothetical protein
MEKQMFLPGMRYQDHAWGVVKKALGEAVLKARKSHECIDLNDFKEAMLQQLLLLEPRLCGQRSTNWLGHDGLMLATDLVLELPRIPRFARKVEVFLGKLGELTDSALRKQANDVFVELRDELDARNFVDSTGEPMKANMIVCLRNTERSVRATKKCIKDWRSNLSYASQILGREIDLIAEPIEVRRLEKYGRCEVGWVLRWSEYHHLYYRTSTGNPAIGRLHTKSKKCSFVKNLATWLKMTDPITGTFSALISVHVPDVNLLMTLIRLDEEEDKNDDLTLRIQPQPKDTDESSTPDEQQGADSESECCDEEMNEDGSEYDEEDILLSPSKPFVSESVGGEANEEPKIAFSDCIDPTLELPVKVGIFLDVARDYNDLLLEMLEYWGVFDLWGLPVSLNKKILSRIELARRLSELRGEEVTRHLFDKEVETAREKLEACIKQRLIDGVACKGDE